MADGTLYAHANEVLLDEHPVVIIRSGRMKIRRLMLSVCSNQAGWPRSLVGSLKDSDFCCYDPSCCSKQRKFVAQDVVQCVIIAQQLPSG